LLLENEREDWTPVRAVGHDPQGSQFYCSSIPVGWKSGQTKHRWEINKINYQSVELLIGQETLVRISRKADNTNADFPEFNLLSCDTQVFDWNRKFLTESLILAQDERWRRA
jgi:hypothetical protein